MDFLISILPDSIKNIPTHMDFDGQRRAERFFQVIIIIFAVVGFIWGYITQHFSQTLYILFAGVFLSSVLTLIPWHIYRQCPLEWQPAREDWETSQSGKTAPTSQGKSKKKKIKE